MPIFIFVLDNIIHLRRDRASIRCGVIYNIISANRIIIIQQHRDILRRHVVVAIRDKERRAGRLCSGEELLAQILAACLHRNDTIGRIGRKTEYGHLDKLYGSRKRVYCLHAYGLFPDLLQIRNDILRRNQEVHLGNAVVLSLDASHLDLAVIVSRYVRYGLYALEQCCDLFGHAVDLLLQLR